VEGVARRWWRDRSRVTLLHVEAVQRWLRGHLLCSVPDSGPRFALTFDDGPSSRNTPALLDVLARHGAHATFFVMCSRAQRHAEMIRQVMGSGHEIGVHGHWHLPAWAMPRAWLVGDIERTVDTILEVGGSKPRHYRAPFGLLWPAQARAVRALGLVPVLGDVYPRDHAFHRPEPIVARVTERLTRGSIVILHDSSALMDADRSGTIAAVDRILEAAARRGLASVTVAELSAAQGPPAPL
jgi:peptidoglycan/xylan/chitin deacetylase (PgdA/CDA1 family)